MTYDQPHLFTVLQDSRAIRHLRIHKTTADELTDLLLHDDVYLRMAAPKNAGNVGEALEVLASALAANIIGLLEAESQARLEETDNIRLTRALQSLSPEIQVFEDFACCQTCAFSDIDEAYESGCLPEDAAGFVFYNQQTTEHAYDHGILFLSYGSFNNGADSVEVAVKLVAALEVEGFTPAWDGSEVQLNGLNWQTTYHAD